MLESFVRPRVRTLVFLFVGRVRWNSKRSRNPTNMNIMQRAVKITTYRAPRFRKRKTQLVPSSVLGYFFSSYMPVHFHFRVLSFHWHGPPVVWQHRDCAWWKNWRQNKTRQHGQNGDCCYSSLPLFPFDKWKADLFPQNAPSCSCTEAADSISKI